MRIQTGNRVARGFGDVLKYDVLAQVTFTETSSRDTSRLVPGCGDQARYYGSTMYAYGLRGIV